jgi:hypothetical protein
MKKISRFLVGAAACFLVFAGLSGVQEQAFAKESITAQGVIRASGWGIFGKTATVRYLVGEEGGEASLRRSPLAKNIEGEELPIRVSVESGQAKGDSFFGLYGQSISLLCIALALLFAAFALPRKKGHPAH